MPQVVMKTVTMRPKEAKRSICGDYVSFPPSIFGFDSLVIVSRLDSEPRNLAFTNSAIGTLECKYLHSRQVLSEYAWVIAQQRSDREY